MENPAMKLEVTRLGQVLRDASVPAWERLVGQHFTVLSTQEVLCHIDICLFWPSPLLLPFFSSLLPPLT
jgi:hypothetical protein